MPHIRPRWVGEEIRPEQGMRLTDRQYREILAYEAQRIAGALAFLISVDNPAGIDQLATRLRVLAEAIGTGHIGDALVEGEGVLVDAADPAGGERLFVGASPSLWDGLRPLLRGARSLDIVVAYATVGGVRLIHEQLASERGADFRLRILTGCYLGGTRPDALEALLRLARAAPWAAGSGVRFIDDIARHFHPKVYRVVDEAGRVHVAIGSTNLSRSALDGEHVVEWNAMFDATISAALVKAAESHLERLFATEGVPLDEAVIESFTARWPANLPPALLFEPEGNPTRTPVPTPPQQEALGQLEKVRAEGGTRALVVAATGLGKTLLAAFDSAHVATPGSGQRVLFIAHREELLTQARRAFQQVRGAGESAGLVNQYEASTGATLVFASVFSLGKLSDDELASFAYVVIDEAHHAEARSYTRLFEHMKARFTLGLTATPERHDGGDIFVLFDGVVAYEKRLLEAIAEGWLAPFHYFGIPDTVDYSNLKWVGGALGYREAELESAVIDDARMARVIDALGVPDRAGRRTLFFCVNLRHAQHTAVALRKAGWRVARVDSAPDADDRTAAIRRLAAGELDAVVAVDMFNEGIDVPAIDRVVFLRPTDSRTVFLQQLGRGLRKTDSKPHLTVVDLVGNHRRAIEHLDLLGVTRAALMVAVEGQAYVAKVGTNAIFLEPEALDAARAVASANLSVRGRLIEAVRDLAASKRTAGDPLPRPRLVEVLARTGLALSTIRRLFDSWPALLEQAGCDTSDIPAEARALVEVVESTDMSGPHKMLFIAGLARRRRSRATITEAAQWMREELLTRHPSLRPQFAETKDGGAWLEDGRPHGALPRKYPMGILAEAHSRQFVWEGDSLVVRGLPDGDARAADAVAEIAEARLFEMARRSDTAIVGTVVPNGQSLCLNFDRKARRIAPPGTWVRLEVRGGVYFGLVQQIAINRICRQPDERENLATEVLIRASEAANAEGARGRKLRLVPIETGGFEVELGGS